VVAVRPLHCLVLPPEELKPLLHAYPQVMFRLLLGEARRRQLMRALRRS